MLFALIKINAGELQQQHSWVPKERVGQRGKKPRDPWGVNEASPLLGPLLSQRTATFSTYAN